jgi:hypothetical protein
VVYFKKSTINFKKIQWVYFAKKSGKTVLKIGNLALQNSMTGLRFLPLWLKGKNKPGLVKQLKLLIIQLVIKQKKVYRL